MPCRGVRPVWALTTCALFGALLIAGATVAAERRAAGRSSSSVTYYTEPATTEFDEAVARVSSPCRASDRFELLRKQQFANQLGLESLVQWRSGLPVEAGYASYVTDVVLGNQNLYSPYYFGPFEPTPFWPGYIWGYPYINRVAQPIGHKITPKDGDLANGYVYEPVYEEPLPALATIRQATPTPPAQIEEPPLAEAPAPSDAPIAILEPARRALGEADYEIAAAELEQLPAVVQESGESQLIRSAALLALADYEGASTALHRALARTPERDWQTAARALTDDLAGASEYTRLVRQLEGFVDENPNEPAPRFLLGYHYAMRGYAREAVIQLEHALELGIQPKPVEQMRPERVGQDATAVRLLNYVLKAAQQSPRPLAEGPREF